MDEHERIMLDLPAYAASRLDEHDRRVVEAHLGECSDCAEMAGSLATIRDALEAEGATMLEPHPDPMSIRAAALGEPLSDADAVANHVRICTICALETAVWHRRRKRVSGGRRPVWISVAATLVLGIVLGALAREYLPGRPEPVEGAVGGPVLALRSMRGDAVQSFRLGPDQESVVVTVPVPVTEVPPHAGVRYEIRRVDGPPVWSWRLSASGAESLAGSSEVVGMRLATGDLVPGRYELVVTREDAPDVVLQQIRFEIVRPAAPAP